MQRVARVYVHREQGLTPGIRALLESNGVGYVEVDLSGDESSLDRIRERARSVQLPVVELDDRLAGGVNIVVLARALGLKMPPPGFVSSDGCC